MQKPDNRSEIGGRKPAASVGIVSLGCAKNLVDSEHICARLRASGYRFTADAAAAEVLLVNTCAFIEDARKESIDAVLEAASMKRMGACRFLVVTGCLPQRYARDLPEALPEVDAFVGIDRLDDVVAVLDAWRAGKRRAPETAGEIAPPPRRIFDPPPERRPLTGGPFAYVKISEGCNHRCAFCAIPAIRGRARSRKPDAIRAETEALLNLGIREINLVAQDSTAYGRDLEKPANLAGLLRELGRIGGDFWIRVLYCFPTRLSDALLRAMAEIPQVCCYLDVPIQHSHPAALRRMGRGHTATAVHALAERVRGFMPDVTLRTTCLVGHPGESEAEFEHLRAHLEKAAFDHLGVFVYSPEEGTPSAAGAAPRVPAVLARRRRALLLRDQLERIKTSRRKLIGMTERVLVESPPSGRASAGIGRSMRQAPEVDGIVRIRVSGKSPASGHFAAVRYLAVKNHDMLAALT